ncbi:prepilin-type N-terminal cleavage/methylation domain-containing protein [Pseudolysinimonas sp.]|uniref:PulJ/GspJ family protein n=1 Tax=Pseudolysinimonas sp. TaxID=2680009 RepID=UPI00286B799A|nr:prepilin-type N-terminal cleavage/methylation domain-containing protein [Pseudolysinimonas sp.]
MNALIRRLRRDDGFTLTELIASSMLFSLVVLVAGSIFVGQFSAQQQVSAVTTSTTDAQLAGTTIDTGIRNSSGFELTAVGSDQMLVARVAGGGTTLQWVCRAWYYSASADTIRMTSSTPGTPVAAPTASQLETWTLLVDGVHPASGTTIFTDDGDRVTVSFRADTDEDNQPVAIELSSAPLAGVTENTTCY